jgi:hypothetical protein
MVSMVTIAPDSIVAAGTLPSPGSVPQRTFSSVERR